MSDHIFISYKHSDAIFARLLTLELRNAGFEFWWDDNLKPGENWSEAIDDKLRDALAVILLMSPEAQKSEYVTYEWSFAIGAGVPVIPLVIEKIEAIHPRLSKVQYVDLSGVQNPNFDKVMSQLAELRDQRAANAQPRRVIAADAEMILQMERGRDEYHKQNYPRALEIYSNALSSAGDRIKPEVCAQMAYVLCKVSELDRADQLLDQALALRPGYTDALATRGFLCSLRARKIEDGALKSKALREATNALLDALTPEHNLRDMDDESWWATLGGVYRRDDDYRKAISAYEEAVKVTPQSSYPRSNLALLYMQDRQAEKMKQTYRIVERLARSKVQQNILDTWAYADLLLAELALGKYEDATRDLGDFLEILPADSALNVLTSLRDGITLLSSVVAAEEAAEIERFTEQIEAQIAGLPKAP
ncbi:MAG: toll/interleukin-1 receptor domain-containing protein [Chloroflexota bacterium]